MEEFEKYLRLEMNRSAHTVRAYTDDVRQFAAWTGGEASGLTQPGAVTANDIRDWLGHLAATGEKPASLRRKTQSLRALFRWAMKTSRMHTNPAADITLAKLPRRLPDIVKVPEIESILDFDPGDDFRQARLHLVLAMIYGLGLRQAELLDITDNDLRPAPHGADLRITGKGSKERVLPVPPVLLGEIRRWQTIRDSTYPDLPAPKALIAGRHGAISKETLYLAIRKALATTSAARKSPHILRHTFATAMIANGANLDAVRQLLGHASLATTQIYTHLSPAELRQAYNTAHPRAIHKGKDSDKTKK